MAGIFLEPVDLFRTPGKTKEDDDDRKSCDSGYSISKGKDPAVNQPLLSTGTPKVSILFGSSYDVVTGYYGRV